MRKSILAGAVILLTGVLVWLLFFLDNDGHDVLITSKPRGGDFTLQSIDGPVSLRDFRGQVAALYFGYTWCPDICPTSLGILTMAMNELSDEELNQLQAIFISVDPERDTPERMKAYVAFFHENMIGVTGSRKAVDDAVSRYGAAYRIVEQGDSAMGYTVDHSSSIYLVDREGRLVETLPHGVTAAATLAALRKVLNQ